MNHQRTGEWSSKAGALLAFAIGVASIALSQDFEAVKPLPKSQIAEALAHGKQFKSHRDFLKEGLKSNKSQIASAWAKDGISKYVTFYDDLAVISAAAATANEQMRELTEQDIAKIPRTGLLFANVELQARGALPVSKLNRRYTGGRARLVLKIGERLVQPVKEGFYPSPPKTECYNTLYLWSVFGTYNFAVGGIVPVALPCGPAGPSKFSLEFAFQLTPEQMRQKAEVLLIDGDGHQHKTQVDLSRFR
jgi:hypothetical protein